MTPLDHAECCEKATGPDRELDAAIWVHLPEQEGHAWKHGGNRFALAHQVAGVSFVPRYTGSIDAAMTLAPKGSRPIEILHEAIDAAGSAAQLFSERDTVFVKRLPLFVCAVALKARAASVRRNPTGHDRETGHGRNDEPNETLLIAGSGPLLFWCRIFGHKWTPFDMNWCGQDQFRCWRCGGFKLAPTTIPVASTRIKDQSQGGSHERESR